MYEIREQSLSKIKQLYADRPLVVEGANGALGLSLAYVLDKFSIKPSSLYLTTWRSDPHKLWAKLGVDIKHKKRENDSKECTDIIDQRSGVINVLYLSGYGQPKKFQSNAKALIDANSLQLLRYSSGPKLGSFAYASTSEIYTGIHGPIDESTGFFINIAHPRATYCYSKLIGESLVQSSIRPNSNRTAIFRISLAFPPVNIDYDNRLLADLVTMAKNTGSIKIKGGAKVKRQYQWGPNAIIQILGAVACGDAALYVCAGTHKLTVGELAFKIGKLSDVEVEICDDGHELGAHSNSELIIDKIVADSGVLIGTEKSLDEYLLGYIESETKLKRDSRR
jgi:hypothetical protein